MSKSSKTPAERIAYRASEAEAEVTRRQAPVENLRIALEFLAQVAGHRDGDLNLARREIELELESCRADLFRAQGAAEAWKIASQLAEEGPIG